jgi:type II secretory pathway pseudopilin PulG
MTLVESMIAISILTIFLTAALLAAQKGQDAFRRNVHETTLHTKASRALNLIARRLQGARGSALLPDPFPASSAWIGYEQASGWAGGAVVWSTDFEVRLVYASGEVDNGVDDNGDGLIDEGCVVITEDLGGPDQRQVIVATKVAELLQGELPNGVDDNGNGLDDERGLCFEVVGNELIIRVTVQGIDPEGRVTERTLQTSVGLRN